MFEASPTSHPLVRPDYSPEPACDEGNRRRNVANASDALSHRSSWNIKMWRNATCGFAGDERMPPFRLRERVASEASRVRAVSVLLGGLAGGVPPTGSRTGGVSFRLMSPRGKTRRLTPAGRLCPLMRPLVPRLCLGTQTPGALPLYPGDAAFRLAAPFVHFKSRIRRQIPRHAKAVLPPLEKSAQADVEIGRVSD